MTTATTTESSVIRVGMQRVHVAVRRAPQSNGQPPLLLCNGLGANLEMMEPMMEALDDQVDTIAFDVPGVGSSPPPIVPYRPEGLAWLVMKVVDRLGYSGPVDVLGVSWGGVLAQQLAFQYPRRVRRLILAATSAGAFMLPGKVQAMTLLANPRRYYDADHLVKIAPEAYGGALRTNPELARRVFAHSKRPSALGYYAQIASTIGWTSILWLHLLPQRTLVLAGSDDPLVPLANAKLLASKIRNARLHVFDDGHLFLVSRSEEVASLIREFLLSA
jgi:poly(3-hydroxyalkanoate) depolymerase